MIQTWISTDLNLTWTWTWTWAWQQVPFEVLFDVPFGLLLQVLLVVRDVRQNYLFFSASTFRTFNRNSVLPGQLVSPGSWRSSPYNSETERPVSAVTGACHSPVPVISQSEARMGAVDLSEAGAASHLTLVAGLTAPDSRGRMWILLENRFEGNIFQHNV